MHFEPAFVRTAEQCEPDEVCNRYIEACAHVTAGSGVDGPFVFFSVLLVLSSAAGVAVLRKLAR